MRLMLLQVTNPKPETKCISFLSSPPPWFLQALFIVQLAKIKHINEICQSSQKLYFISVKTHESNSCKNAG